MQILKGLVAYKGGATQTLRRDGDEARDRKAWPEAVEHYRRYLDLIQDDADIWVQLGHALKEQGNLEEAAAAYRTAAALVPENADPLLHLGHVLKRLGRPRQAVDAFLGVMRLAPTREVFDELAELGYKTEALAFLEKAPSKVTSPRRYFELRDLFQYLDQHSTVTGISRVVLGLINYVLEDLDEADAAAYEFVHQLGDGDGLSLMSKQKLRQMIRLATAETVDHASMVALIAETRRSAPVIQLKAGDLYFIPGAFWDAAANAGFLPSLKQKGVYVGAYIYDLIPITHAHYCMAGLTQGFNIAFAETVPFYDFTLTISKFVAKQVTDFLQSHRLRTFPAVPVPLAHELHFNTPPSSVQSDELSPTLLALEDREFVLCVCTIEARKNHLYLFYIWQRMIDEGLDVPDLVFVGRFGWRVNDLVGQVDASNYLDGRLHIMHGLSDGDLATLYRRCLFTVFPSFVEGWGLPVGESLSYGKVCVASSTTSIPEVGGDLAVYIDPFDLNSGYKAIQKLITEPASRVALEEKIQRTFVPRTWKDVGRDFFSAVDRAMADLPPADSADTGFAPYLRAGTLLEVHQLQATARRAAYVDNPIRLIFAQGWRGIEEVGTWVRDSAATLRFRGDYDADREISLLLLISMSPWVDEKNTLRIWASDATPKRGSSDGESLYSRPMRRDARFWVRLKGKVGAGKVITIQFRVDGPVVARDPGAISVAVRIHTLGYSASDDYATRMDLLEQTVLVTS